MRYFVLLLAPFLLAGCVAAGAGAAAGAAASELSSGDLIRYYLTVNDVEDRVADAMEEKKIVKGMTKKEVRLIMWQRENYSREPQSIEEGGQEDVRWIYYWKEDEVREPDEILFKDEKVVMCSCRSILVSD